MHMSARNIKSVELADGPMATDAPPESPCSRGEEDRRVYDLVARGMNSGQPIPVDASYFIGLRARFPSKQSD